MKTTWLTIVACLLFTAVVILVYTLWKLRTAQFAGVRYRPGEFPDALVAPSYAEDVYYECRTVNEKMPPGIYSLRFSVNEVFPGERTRTEISQRLEAEGWRRLTYCLMTPQYTALNDWTERKRKDLAFKYIDLMEHWSDPAEQVISLIYSYRLLGSEETPTEPLYVDQAFYSKETWIHKFVAAYRKMHPAEFSESGGAPR